MKNVVSYSLYGNKPLYLVGAVRNAEIVRQVRPDWTARFYVGPSIPASVVSELVARGAEVVRKDGREDASAMFWRFEVFLDPEVALVMVRDCDSRFSARENLAVDEWLRSGKHFHIMRDHPAHDCEILGGLWGAHTSAVAEAVSILRSLNPIGRYGEDQEFLREHVYPLARKNAVIHDSYFAREISARQFPTARNNCEFVGEVIDENEKPREADRDVIRVVQSRPLYRAKMRLSSFIRSHLLS